MHQITPNWHWTLNIDKYWLQPLKTYLWGWNFDPSRYKVARKSEMHWATPNWTWTLNSQKYPVDIKYLPMRLKLWSVSLYGQPFQRYYFIIPHWLLHVKHTHPLVETLPRSMHAFWSESDVYFQRRCRLKFFLPYSPI